MRTSSKSCTCWPRGCQSRYCSCCSFKGSKFVKINEIKSRDLIISLRGRFPDGAAAPLDAGDDQHVGEEKQHPLLAAARYRGRHCVVSKNM